MVQEKTLILAIELRISDIYEIDQYLYLYNRLSFNVATVCQESRSSRMKNRHALFALTVTLLLQPSRGGIFLIGQQMPDLYQKSRTRGLGRRRLSSFEDPLEFDVPRTWKKGAGFHLRKRLASVWNGIQEIAQTSNMHAVPNLDYEDVGTTKRKLFGLFEWNPGSLARYYLLFRIVWWFLEICFEAISEVKQELNEEFGSSNKKAFARNSVERLISWLEKPQETRPAQPSNINPAWLIPLGQELSKCSALSLVEVQRILLQLSSVEAVLLHQCLLSSNEKVDFSEIGGLFRAKKIILDLLRSGIGTMIPSQSSPAASPYEAMISKGNGRQNILLWGPPGNGKTLLIRAFAKKGFPALVLTPTLLQSHKQLETFFSLVSTLGSCQLILDDIDGIFPTRGNGKQGVPTEIRAELLQRLDTLTSHSVRMSSKNYVSVFAATNIPWGVDAAAWRRFPNRLYVGLPNAEDRYDLLRIFSEDLPSIEKSVLDYFVSVTDGFIPLDLYQVLVYACQNGPMVRQDTTLSIEDVQLALSAFVPTRFSAHYIQLLQSFISSNSRGTNVPPKAQQPSSSTVRDYFSPRVIQVFPYGENGYCWETALGNYYQLQIPVDSDVLDAIRTILLHSSGWNPGEDWDISDDDGDDDDDYI